MQQGTCKWFNEVKGYGFITVDGDERDAFVHFKDIQMPGFRKLIENQRCEFEIVEGPKGLSAKNVYPLDGAQ